MVESLARQVRAASLMSCRHEASFFALGQSTCRYATADNLTARRVAGQKAIRWGEFQQAAALAVLYTPLRMPRRPSYASCRPHDASSPGCCSVLQSCMGLLSG